MACLSRLLSRFEETQRTVLILRMRDDMSYDEIAKTIGKSTEATKKIFHRGFQRLIEQLPESWRD